MKDGLVKKVGEFVDINTKECCDIKDADNRKNVPGLGCSMLI